MEGAVLTLTTFALGFVLAWVLAIIKEHADRKKVVKALVFISGQKPDPLRWLAVNKSWWQQIQERMKPIILMALGAVLAWLVIKIATGA